MTLWTPIPDAFKNARLNFEQQMKEDYGCVYVTGKCTVHTGHSFEVTRKDFDYDKAKRIVNTRSKNSAKPKHRGTKSGPEQPGLLK